MVTVFLPCRAGSERVKNKNTRAFAGNLGGLLAIKIAQLLSCFEIDKIIVSTNDDVAMSIVTNLHGADPRVELIRRPEMLCGSHSSTDDVIKYVPTVIEHGPVLWTHVTSPFVTGYHYKEIIKRYLADMKSGDHDSLMTVTEVRTFVWNEQGPINYERTVEKWPRTQTIKPLFEVNSAAFMVDVEMISRVNDRIGRRPRLFPLDRKVSFDIDWPDDFDIAELIWHNLHNIDFES
ncbi:CMP-N-acetylneuraminic acid synthetase [Rhizobium sp. PP-F2F-G20b]|nr:CMP-N-acetylneuraminic acid synthetase [Rhizobium sp. PP-F2F-G20b]